MEGVESGIGKEGARFTVYKADHEKSVTPPIIPDEWQSNDGTTYSTSFCATFYVVSIIHRVLIFL